MKKIALVCLLPVMVVLYAILPFLEREEEYYRLNAVELVRIASGSNPKSVYANPVSKHEYAQMSRIFTEKILPRLRKMEAEGVSPKERKAAAEAIAEITMEIGR